MTYRNVHKEGRKRQSRQKEQHKKRLRGVKESGTLATTEYEVGAREGEGCKEAGRGQPMGKSLLSEEPGHCRLSDEQLIFCYCC